MPQHFYSPEPKEKEINEKKDILTSSHCNKGHIEFTFIHIIPELPAILDKPISYDRCINLKECSNC